ncbi:MAG: peptide deformylase [Candidatus Omnitrophota bacterium]
MEELKLCINDDPILRKRSKKLTKVTDEDRELFNRMLEVMHREKGVGLAAPQIGINKQMLVVDIGLGPLKLANPKVLRCRNKCFMEESCLSLPGIQVDVRRAKCVEIAAQNECGERVRIEAKDLLARALLHEIDHLNGTLIIDYMPWYKRLQLKRKWKKNPVLKD